MRMLAKLGTVLLLALVSISAQAFVELNTFYNSDTLTAATSPSLTQTYIDACIGFSVDKKSTYLVGWNYSLFTIAETTTTSTTYSSTQMGPRFVIQFGKQNQWSLGFAYNLQTTATYNAGSDETWKGTALKVDFGYNFNISEYLNLGVRVNYAAATYVEKLVGATTYSTISYARTHIYPSVYLIYDFKN